ncbi:MAG: acyl-ACP--UDP-N-acetylglucosamine O-acyltransferase [Gammaproteobacteria bacterium]|nr:acyl-ACP--UDP-N-acetylglucosamine O-acyltransferase [Gammaproteobacteria bacterium]
MIDSRAVIDSSARIGEGVTIGPFSVIGPDVEIAAGTWIGPHVVISGPCKIGRDNKIFQFASIGAEPQDKKYSGEPTLLEIGDRNVIRECCTLNRGTVQGGGITRMGSDNWIMAYVHIAHDCVVGNNTIFANNATLAGHVTIEDYAILGGAALIHQFCCVGAHSFTAMGSSVAKDVPPFLMISGQMAQPHGLNVEGLKRRGFTADDILALRRAYKIVYRSNLTVVQALEELKGLAQENGHVARFAEFVAKSERGIVR